MFTLYKVNFFPSAFTQKFRHASETESHEDSDDDDGNEADENLVQFKRRGFIYQDNMDRDDALTDLECWRGKIKSRKKKRKKKEGDKWKKLCFKLKSRGVIIPKTLVKNPLVKKILGTLHRKSNKN